MDICICSVYNTYIIYVPPEILVFDKTEKNVHLSSETASGRKKA